MDEYNNCLSEKLRKLIMIITVLTLIAGGLVWFFFRALDTDDFMENKKVEEYDVKTTYGDQFHVNVELGGIPDPTYFFSIYVDKPGNGRDIVLYTNSQKDRRIEFEFLYESKQIRCYSILNKAIIYKIKENNQYASILFDSLPNADKEHLKLLYPLAKYMFSKYEWNWVRVFAEFLIKAGDTETINILKRYSKGVFTQEELQKNINNKYTKEDMQQFCMQLLDKFRINYNY